MALERLRRVATRQINPPTISRPILFSAAQVPACGALTWMGLKSRDDAVGAIDQIATTFAVVVFGAFTLGHLALMAYHYQKRQQR